MVKRIILGRLIYAFSLVIGFCTIIVFLARFSVISSFKTNKSNIRRSFPYGALVRPMSVEVGGGRTRMHMSKNPEEPPTIAGFVLTTKSE